MTRTPSAGPRPGSTVSSWPSRLRPNASRRPGGPRDRGPRPCLESYTGDCPDRNGVRRAASSLSGASASRGRSTVPASAASARSRYRFGWAGLVSPRVARRGSWAAGRPGTAVLAGLRGFVETVVIDSTMAAGLRNGSTVFLLPPVRWTTTGLALGSSGTRLKLSLCSSGVPSWVIASTVIRVGAFFGLV